MTRVRIVFDHSDQVARDIQRAVGAALREIGEDCLEKSNRIVPLEEGPLQASGFTEVDERALEGVVGYSTPYAVIQHEDPTLRHDPGRESHYLEKTVHRNQGAWQQRMARAAGRL